MTATPRACGHQTGDRPVLARPGRPAPDQHEGRLSLTIQPSLFNTAETPPLAVGSLVMQNYPEQQQYAAVTRVYRLGRWVADVTWHRPEGNVPDLMQDVDSLVVVTREQLDAVTPPLAVAAEGHAGKIVQAIVSRWAGHFTVRCSCLGSLEVCRDGRQIGWSRTQQSAQRLWEWHTAGEQGPAPAAGAP